MEFGREKSNDKTDIVVHRILFNLSIATLTAYSIGLIEVSAVSNLAAAAWAGHEHEAPHAAPHSAPHPAAHAAAQHASQAHQQQQHAAQQRQQQHQAQERQQQHQAQERQQQQHQAQERQQQHQAQERQQQHEAQERQQQHQAQERQQQHEAQERQQQHQAQERQQQAQEHQQQQREGQEREEQAQRQAQEHQQQAQEHQQQQREGQERQEHEQQKSLATQHPNRAEGLGRDGNLNNPDQGHLSGHRPFNPPPFHGNPAPFQKAGPAPFVPGRMSAAQQAQAAQGYQNFQHNIYPVPMSQAPPNYQQIASAQNATYLNNCSMNVCGQQININSGNTFANPCPPSACPPWWGSGGGGYFQPGPGWGWSNGFTLGSVIRASLGWLRFGWPGYYGPPPTGFIYPPAFVPTPWIYNPFLNRWRQPGLPGWAPAPPPPEYVMPITVQCIEPIQILAPGPGGVAIPETVNQIVLYNAHYFPAMGRWGYRNRLGYFNWVNTFTATAPAPI